ncbi:putative transcription factor interactor and regulator CCHC(Zn) family [Helianthus anomalus]
MDCLEKDKQFHKLKKYTDEVKFDLNDAKEAYDTLARSIKMIKKESFENDKATNLLKATVMEKQMDINIHLDTIASLKRELELILIETERIDKKLMSYVASSYIIDQIVPQQREIKAIFKNVPPPMWNHYTQKDPDGVESALNLKFRTIENELPENIDVTFSPSDTNNESQVIKTVVDKVLDEESDNSDFGTAKTHLENSTSDSKDDGNFLDKFISKSDRVVNDDSIIVVYTMTGTDKLYSDFEYQIQNARLENVEKVFKLVEIDILEVNNNTFLLEPKKSFVKPQPNNSGKKERVGNGGNNKRNGDNFKNKGVGLDKKMAKKNVKPKDKMSDVFVAGPSVDAEKDYIFSQKAVDDFNAAKRLKEVTNKSTFVEYDKRICYRYNEIGHMAKQCVKKIEKPTFQKPKPKTSNDVKGKTSYDVKGKTSNDVKGKTTMVSPYAF